MQLKRICLTFPASMRPEIVELLCFITTATDRNLQHQLAVLPAVLTVVSQTLYDYDVVLKSMAYTTNRSFEQFCPLSLVSKMARPGCLVNSGGRAYLQLKTMRNQITKKVDNGEWVIKPNQHSRLMRLARTKGLRKTKRVFLLESSPIGGWLGFI